MQQSKGLTIFLRNECANYHKHDEACLFGEPCKVMKGKRCDYFEKAVLGPPDHRYKLPGYDYGKLFAQYTEQTKAEQPQVNVRRCECGTPLRHRQRYCDDCTMKRRRKTKRVSQKAWRMAV
jgi:hypothetical protein